ncbi:MAG: class I SAM-dependent methyltransferase [Gammaproteobacteria bacterium]|nr:class I SAM-dependent methyltransferase [Gammaproteobacteria bacterium]
MITAAPTQIDPSMYENWRGSALGRTTDARERELLLDLIGDVTGQVILDVGCGDGELAVELWKRGAKITGIDASTRMIEVARERARQHRADLTFDVATAQALPFPPKAFDLVVAVTVLCFIEDGASTLREMGRVLRPGGRLVIGELGKWSTWAAGRRMRGWLGNPVWRHACFRSAHELRDLADQAGFVVETLRGAIYYPPFGPAARLLGPVDRDIARLTTFGAAFLALAITKPIV